MQVNGIAVTEPVTEDNKRVYAKAKFDFTMRKCVASEIKSFKDGLTDVVCPKAKLTFQYQ